MKVLKAYPLKRLEKLIEIQECRTLISLEATYDLKHGLKSVEQPINISISNQSCLCKGITYQLLNDIELLSTQTYTGKKWQEYLLMPEHYRRLVSGVYLCFYRVIENTIYIYHIIDSRTNYRRLLKNENDQIIYSTRHHRQFRP